MGNTHKNISAGPDVWRDLTGVFKGITFKIWSGDIWYIMVHNIWYTIYPFITNTHPIKFYVYKED